MSGSVGGMAAAPQGLVDSRDNWRTPTSVPMVLCSLRSGFQMKGVNICLGFF